MEGNLNFLRVPKTRHESFMAARCVGMHIGDKQTDIGFDIGT